MNASGNIISDIIVLLLPLPMINGLRLPRNQKIALAGIFGLGFLSVAPTLYPSRFLAQGAYVNKRGQQHLRNQRHSDSVPRGSNRRIVDLCRCPGLFPPSRPSVCKPQSSQGHAQFWSVAEVCSGIVCSALPTLRPLFGKWLPHIFASAQHVSSSYRSGSGRKPNDIENSGLRTRGTRRGTKQFSRSRGEADEELMVSPAEHEAGGTAFLTLSNSSIELQDRPDPDPNAHGKRNSTNNGGNDYCGRSSHSFSYPGPIYAGPILGSPRRSIIVGGESSQTAPAQEHEGSVIRVKHEFEIRHDR